MNSDFNLSTTLKVHKKTIIIAITILLSLITLTLLIVHLINKSWFPLKNENLLSETPSSEINRFKKAVERELNSYGYPNVNDATIREGSISTTQEKGTNDSYAIYKTTFFIDIDSIKQTYLASIIWLNSGETKDDSVSLFCPKPSDSKYPDSECETSTSSSHDTALHLPYEFTQDNKKVVVKDFTNGRAGKTLQIYLYSCNSDNPPLEATEQRVRDWVKNTIKDPLADKYLYHVRYGYCKDDVIPN